MNDLIDRLSANGDALSPSGFAVLNPANGACLATVKDWTRTAAQGAIETAHQVQPAWAKRTGKVRAQILRAWFNLIMANQEALAEVITAECGKPMAESMGEVAYGASFVEWFAEEAKRSYGDVVPATAADKQIVVLKQPVGTCAAVTPWNFPVAMVTRKVAPALAAGCSIVLKPAEATPLSALILEQLAKDAGVPEGLFTVITTQDPKEIGDLFCTSELVRKFSFTGSTAVGKMLAAKCAGTVKRVSLELGGNAPFIVFDDADLESALDGLFASKFRNAGQTCVCANRVLVQDGIHDAFLSRLIERTRALKVGDGSDEGIEIGPLISSAGVDKVVELVASATESGAQLAHHDPTHLHGQFYPPTVLDGVTQEMDIAHAEIFGPVVSVMRFGDEEEAIRMANDTPYGLAAYFYTRDLGRAWRVLEGLEYGMVAVNDGMLSTEVAPFGGIKESGIGREGSRHGLDEYLELKYGLMSGLGR